MRESVWPMIIGQNGIGKTLSPCRIRCGIIKWIDTICINKEKSLDIDGTMPYIPLHFSIDVKIDRKKRAVSIGKTNEITQERLNFA